jgi:hypothetical protein
MEYEIALFDPQLELTNDESVVKKTTSTTEQNLSGYAWTNLLNLGTNTISTRIPKLVGANTPPIGSGNVVVGGAQGFKLNPGTNYLIEWFGGKGDVATTGSMKLIDMASGADVTSTYSSLLDSVDPTGAAESLYKTWRITNVPIQGLGAFGQVTNNVSFAAGEVLRILAEMSNSVV